MPTTHSQPKEVHTQYSTLEPEQLVDLNGVVFEAHSLYDTFQQLPDPRQARGKRYELVTLLTLIFAAKLSGADTPSAMADWCQGRRDALVALLGLPYPKMPSHHTLRRVLRDGVDEDALEAKMREYGERQRAGRAAPRRLAVDGKQARGSLAPGESQGEATLSVYDVDGGEVLASAAIDPAEGEIPAALPLLAQLDLQGTVVLADALHTQRKLCRHIVQAGGDYLLTVKENQPTTYQAIESLFAPTAPNRALLEFRTAGRTSKGHGRLERRTLTAVALFPGEIDWPHLRQAFRLARRATYLRQGQVVRVEEEVHYGLTSLTPPEADAAQLLALKRAYWRIENGLHYRRDVTFREDATRMAHPHAMRNLTTVHHTILSLFARLGCENAAQTRRRLDADLGQALSLLISAHPRL